MLDEINGNGKRRAEKADGEHRQVRNPGQTRARILKVATAEFSANGFNGARVDRIAEKCRLSKNMLYYHFGGKEDLFIAVLEGAYEKLRARQNELVVQPGDPVASIRQLIHHTFYALHDHPELIWLLNEENLYKARHIRRSKRMRELYDPLVAQLSEILAAGSAQGIFRSDLDPKIVYLSLSSLSYHYLSNQYTLQIILGLKLTSAEFRGLWLDHVSELIIQNCSV